MAVSPAQIPQSSQTSTAAWVMLALTAASVEPILIKLGFQAQATPIQLLVLKNLVAAFAMLLMVRGWQRPREVKFSSVITVSLLLFATNAFCLFALTKLTAVELITIITSTPAVVALVNCLRRHDRRGRWFWPGLAASLVGVALSLQSALPGSSFSINVVGAIMALAAVFSSTVYRIKIETILRQVDPRVMSLNIFVVNGVVSLLLTPWLGAVNPSVIPFVLWMGVAGALANLAFIAAVKALGATRMSIINLIQRPLVVLIAALVLKEALGWPQVLGFILVMLGVQMAQVTPKAAAEKLSASLPPSVKDLCGSGK